MDSARAGWEGQAQVSFDQLMQRYNDSARKLQGALTDISENIRANARDFEHIEAENDQAFTRVAGGLAL